MENELKVNGSKNFMGIDIPIIEGGFGDNRRIVTAKTISEIHGTRLADVNATVKRLIDKKRLKESVDYLDCLSETVSLRNFADELGLIGSNRTQNVFILSERGYTKLIKAMDDDKSWDVMDQFIDEYFTMREQVKNLLSVEDKYVLSLYHAETKEEVLLLAKQHNKEVVQPLRDSVDRYERYLCEKTGMLTKTELAIKLDTKPQTLAAKLKKVNVYTKTSQISGDFLKKYPNVKIVVECESTYRDWNGVQHSKPDFQWSFLGSKILVDYLIAEGMVTYTENNGFKLVI